MGWDGMDWRTGLTSTTGEKVIPSSLTVSLSPASIVDLSGVCCSIPRMKPWVHWGMRGKSRNCVVKGVWVSDLEGWCCSVLGGGRTILRRWAGEHAISSVVEMRTMLVDVRDAVGDGFLLLVYGLEDFGLFCCMRWIS
jgi:hypothetical protein